MESIVDFEYYSNTYGGEKIPQSSFKRISIAATLEVKNRIMNKDYTNYEDEVKSVTCEVAEILYNQEMINNRINEAAAGEGLIQSESLGDYSRSYSSGGIGELKSLADNADVQKQITQIIDKHLLYTGLVYRGIKNV